ncbi:hypothetical protein AMECASPLE_032454 [Ameca splendens]|uniref:Uncharacterized protein n=1 Tax=Ameca splendens TaxID=208324 RepID=A0ABV0ZRU5_9TELE
MSFCQQRDISALPFQPVSHIVRVVETGCSKSGAFIWTVTSQEVRSYPVQILTKDESGSLGSWFLSPAVYGREAEYALDRSPIHHRATQRHAGQTTIHTLIHI